MGSIEEFAVRRASLADIPALKALIELSVRGLQTNEYTAPEIEGALGHALGLDTQLIEDGTYFAVEDAKGELIASGGWSYRQKLCGSDGLESSSGGCNSAGDARSIETAKIRAIFVHPAWARKGLGSLVLAHCEQKAQQAGFTRLEMGSTLTGVLLYRLRGYVEQERMAIPLPNGESLTVVHMIKDLNETA